MRCIKVYRVVSIRSFLKKSIMHMSRVYIVYKHLPINSLRMRMRSCSLGSEMMTQLMKASSVAR